MDVKIAENRRMFQNQMSHVQLGSALRPVVSLNMGDNKRL